MSGPGIRQMKRDGTPITRQDVIRYVQLAGMPHTLGPSPTLTVTFAELLTSAEISARLHGASTGYASNALLWFVEMRGTFVFPGPPHSHVVQAHVGYQIFDPTTGNLIMYGGLG